DVRDPQVARVDEADELGRLAVQERVRPDWVGRAGPALREPGPDVGQPLVGRGRVAAVAVNAAEADRLGLGVWVVLPLVALDAPGALGGGLLGRLAREVDGPRFRWRRGCLAHGA